MTTEEVVEKKKRGRPSKAVIAEREAAAIAAQAAAESPIDPDAEALEDLAESDREREIVRDQEETYGEALETWRPAVDQPFGQCWVTRSTLLDVLAVLGRASSKNSVPILSETVRLQVGESAMDLQVTDLDLSVWVQVDAHFTKPSPGAVVVSLPVLRAAVALSDEDVLIEPASGEPGKITVGDHRIAVMGAAPFPEMPLLGGVETQLVSTTAAFVAELDRVTKFVAGEKETARPVLQSVQIVAGSDGVRLAGADVTRLAATWLHAPDRQIAPHDGDAFEVHLGQPARVASILRAIAGPADAPQGGQPLGLRSVADLVEFSVEGNSETYTIYGHQVMGAFPDVSKLIPEPDGVFLADRARLLEVLKLMLPATGDGSVVTLALPALEKGASLDEQSLRLVAACFEHVVPLSRCSLKGLQTIFNAKLLVEALASGEGDRVLVCQAGPTTPAVLSYETVPWYWQVVMPLREAAQ